MSAQRQICCTLKTANTMKKDHTTHAIIIWEKMIPFLIAVILSNVSNAQSFVEKQTRHRFAQNNIGVDLQTSIGGSTFVENLNGGFDPLEFAPTSRARIIIGGLHFWGHADFHIAIPVMFPKVRSEDKEIFFTTGVETVFKYYPWQLKSSKLRPYVGFSLAPNYYQQDDGSVAAGEGQELSHVSVPAMFGATYMKNNKIVEAGITWNYANKQDYYLNRTDYRTISTPPIYASLALKFVFDTTIGAEKGWESGDTQKRIERLASEGKLDGLFIGAGLSSAWWLGQSEYNVSTHPYIENYGISLMGDFSMGYYFHKPDLNIAMNYRKYGASPNVYGVVQNLNRRSIGLEVTKYFLDYHGFDPFIGPVVSSENLSFSEIVDGTRTHDLTSNQINVGLAFGWDIRPDRNQAFVLRTSLRWFPDLNIALDDGQKVSFDNLEFNFIQVVLFPNRMW